MKTLKLLILIVFISMYIGCGKKEKPQDNNTANSTAEQSVKTKVKDSPEDAKVVMQIGEQKYTNKDFKNFIKLQYAGIAEESPNPRLLSRLFDSFAEQKLIGYVANQQNIPVSDEEYQNYVRTLEKPSPNQSPHDKNVIIEAIKIQKYLNTKIYNSINVSQKEIEAYYNSHKDDYRIRQQILLHQILVPNREQALKIIGELNNNPQKFEEIARTQSISQEKVNGGKMGYFEEGTLPQDMEKAVFSLKINSISPIFQSDYGFHIFKVSEKKKERLQFLEKVAGEIKNKVMSEKLSNAFQEFLDRSRKELKIIFTYDALYFKYHPVDAGGQETNTGDRNNENTSSNDADTTNY